MRSAGCVINDFADRDIDGPREWAGEFDADPGAVRCLAALADHEAERLGDVEEREMVGNIRKIVLKPYNQAIISAAIREVLDAKPQTKAA